MKYEDGKAVSTWPSRPRNAWLTLMPIAGMALEIAAAQPALGARLIAASHGSAENRPASTEAVASPSKQDPASEIARGGSRLWYPVAEDSLATPAPTSGRIVAQRYRTLRLDHSGLINVLARAPLERTDEARDVEVVMELPWPDGRFRSFRIEESPIMEPELAAQFPEMKTYRGQGINDGTASVRFDWTPTGFHALVLSGEGEVLIDPHSPGDTQNYIVYYRRDYKRRGTFHCTVVDNELRGRTEGDAAAGPDQPQHGATLRTYRIAVAATGEYTASHGGTVAGAMNGIVTTMNRVNGIYERDLAVRMNLIGSNSSIVYTDPSTDPYTNADTSAMLCENARNLDAVIGVGSYDVGHVFSTAPGGRASAGVCSAVNACGSPSGSVKGQGASGLQIPLQDAFDVDVVAHEIGHQFGATHTFNGTTGTSCANGRFASTAFEPGSGSTILAYPGLCGAENIQANSDAYFHAGSQDQIITFITNAATGGSCDVESATSNAAPTANAGPDYTVPRGTPFILTASGIDTKGTYLNYAWEEMDLGTASPPHTDDGSRPLFRSFPPSASPSRTFPRLSDILNNTTTFGESLPTTTRSMNFRVTLRDNRLGGGGTASDDMVLNVRADSGPFSVTQPNSAVAWPAGSDQTVTWDVANTAAAPVSCANVKISLSTDGGNTFPIVLAESTPNDGSHVVGVPNYPTTTARIKVEAVANVFFDISNANFTISTSVSALSINDITVSEGNAGTATVNFSVTIAPTNASIVTVSYATANGTATAGSDYVSAAGTLTFAPGQSSKTVTVIVNGDTASESDETFFVNLSGATNATIADGQGVATISNDEGSLATPGLVDGTFEAGSPWPAWTVQTSTNRATPICNTTTCNTFGGITAPYAGTNWAWFGGFIATETSTLGQSVILPVSSSLTLRFRMKFATVSGAITPETLVVRVDGTPVHTFAEPASAESAYSLREVDLTPFANGGSHALLFTYSNTLPLTAYANILIDNVELFSYPASLSINDVAVTEGNAGTATAIFTVTLAPTRASTVTVAYVTADGTATAGSDYVSGSDILTFAPGESTKTVAVVVNGDATSEPNETFFVNLSGAVNATITDAQGVGTITNDDCGASTSAVADGTFEAGNPWPGWTVQTSTTFGTPLCNTALCGTGAPPYAGSNWAWFGGVAAAETATLGQTVSLPLSRSVTLRFQMRIVGTAPPTDTLVVSVDGVPVRTFQEPAVAESAYSLRQIDLTPFANGAAHALLFRYDGPTSGVANFTVDNVELFSCPSVLPSVSINDVLVPEGNSGTTTTSFTATLSTTSAQTVTVAYTTSGSGATPGSDYISASGTLTFPPGTTTQPIAITVNGDTLDEPTEVFVVNLSAPTNATISDSQGAGYIEDNDPEPSLSVNDVTVTEGSSGSVNATFTVTLSPASGQEVRVSYTTADGTATTAGLDYAAASGTLTFAPGVTTQSITVVVNGDTTDEANEILFVNLGTQWNATIADGHGVGSITDDDP